ncbi:DNA polymerase kappa [Fistulifera solaris]|uniref:DNA polymerase kappa n=1 Tax=Fistulifera solaris TaxID=1519565 RepID=A0A1Z5KCL5_FISSO|nr:DNA polymerase kappa [Fistulifera solaris]|eukprot:GAX23658.1 DNA polymerase kappa [Fistulifera solaris]
MLNPYKRKRSREELPAEETTADASALVIAAADKAGMDGIDRRRIDAIILRESGNSLYIQQQKRRDEKVNERIVAMKKKLQNQRTLYPQWPHESLPAIDRMLTECIRKRPNRSTCVVVDMDMFYMACELLTRPELHDKPACVGGGMILTSNYPARKYGVRSAMAGWIGDALVRELSNGTEELIHVPSNHQKYAQQSQVVRSVLAEYDPQLRAYSLDEAFLNLGPYLACHLLHPEWSHEQISKTLREGQEDGDVKASSESEYDDNGPDDDSIQNESHDKLSYLETLGQFSNHTCLEAAGKILTDMRQKVFERTGGLTCSAGLAPNFMMAKIASDRNKPNGQCLVASDQDSIREFLYPMATRKVSGIGRVTEKLLRAFDIHTVEHMYEQRALIQQLFTPVQANFLLQASVGCSSSDNFLEDEQEESKGGGQKGISRERTFRPGHSWNEINARLEDIGRLLSSDMQRKSFWAHTITVKVKLHTFDVLSRARTLPRGVFVQSPEDLVRHSTELLAEVRHEFMASPEHRSKPFSVRLLGIRCNNFRHEQETESTGWDQLNLDQFLLPRSTLPVFRAAAAQEGIIARCDTNMKEIFHDSPTFEVEGTNDHDDAYDATTIMPTNDSH